MRVVFETGVLVTELVATELLATRTHQSR